MSVTTSFKHPRPFPFSPDTTPPAGMDYVVVSEADARRMWWSLETVQLSPRGTVEAEGFPFSYTVDYKFPSPTPTDLEISFIYGAMYDGVQTDTSTAPSDRILSNDQDILAMSYVYTYSPQKEEGSAQFRIVFVEGEWRLYYSFYFPLTDEFIGEIGNTSSDLFTEAPTVGSGSFLFFGYEIQWVAKATDTVTVALSLTAEFTEYTYPEP